MRDPISPPADTAAASRSSATGSGDGSAAPPAPVAPTAQAAGDGDVMAVGDRGIPAARQVAQEFIQRPAVEAVAAAVVKVYPSLTAMLTLFALFMTFMIRVDRWEDRLKTGVRTSDEVVHFP